MSYLEIMLATYLLVCMIISFFHGWNGDETVPAYIGDPEFHEILKMLAWPTILPSRLARWIINKITYTGHGR